MQLLYLHRILNKEETHWTKKILTELEQLNLGWYKGIKTTLSKYQLEENFETIKNIRAIEWKSQVIAATEKCNQKRLLEECYKKEDNKNVPKTKTAHIISKLESNEYKREPCKEIMSLTKRETKMLIIARFGMLECGKNFKGTMGEICLNCNTRDTEEHRLNECSNYLNVNYVDHDENIPFSSIYSEDLTILKPIMKRIGTVWNLKTGNGSMN